MWQKVIMPAQSSSKLACLTVSSISREVLAVSLYSTGKGRSSPATISLASASTLARVSSPYKNCEPTINQNVIVYSFSMISCRLYLCLPVCRVQTDRNKYKTYPRLNEAVKLKVMLQTSGGSICFFSLSDDLDSSALYLQPCLEALHVFCKAFAVSLVRLHNAACEF